MLVKLAWKSLLARKVTVCLTVFAISLSVLVLLAIQHIKDEAKSSFTSTVSGVDLIVGTRTGQLNLLLYSVFRIGNATNNISWESYEALAASKEVAWTIPISLGDSHRGFRVVGTTADYFKHFKYGNKKALALAEGNRFAGTFDAVLGADVAKKLGYTVGDKIVLAHGLGATSFSEHSDSPFTVAGVLEATGTPVDQALYVPLEGIEAIHLGWESGLNLSSHAPSGSTASNRELMPESITAFMVGLNSKISTFTFQSKVNQYGNEALLAILPGVALAELWRMMGMVEGTLLAISALVLVAALLGMSTMMLAAMRERRQEFAVLRAIGASPLFIVVLIQLEAIVTTLIAILVAIILLWLGLGLTQDLLSVRFGLFVSTAVISIDVLKLLLVVVILAVIVGIIPAAAAYKSSRT